jgi:hypothetical protein
MNFAVATVVLVLQVAPPVQVPDHRPVTQPAAQVHQHQIPDLEIVSTLCPICPVERAADGTSWQPDSASLAHIRWHAAGSWRYAVHVDASMARVDEGGPRGDRGRYSTNYGMANVRRSVGGGVFGVQTMWSVEPAMGPRGYPLLLQSGETADDVNTLVDRQHPHDLPMELAATYARPLDDQRAWYIYVAAVGAPALGPPAFMHRASGALLPVSPITHHWFDSTHITYGVVTAGFVTSPRVKFEASVFRGREPDKERWGFERPGLDSFAFRLSVNPTSNLSLQVSAGILDEAERLHPGADVTRLTASLMHSKQLSGIAIDSTLAWGRNRRDATVIPVTGGFYSFPEATANAVLGETTIQRGRHAAIFRFERAVKDELFPLDDPRHGTLFSVSRLTLGYAFRVLDTEHARIQIGSAGAWNRVDSVLESVYGNDPRSWLLFARLAVH